MNGTFTYDFISFLRVLYHRRVFIISGTIGIAILMVIVSLIWPEIWRAQTSILVTTPQYKEELRLVPEPFDVKTYQGLLTSDNLYMDVLHSLRWYRQAIDQLTQPDTQQQIQNHLGNASELTPLELIENTNPTLMSELLFGPDSTPSEIETLLLNHFSQFGRLDLDTISNMEPRFLEKLTVFDLRKKLHTNVSIVKETNLETVYSNLIDVSAEFDTAVGAKILCNTWILLFTHRAEATVEEVIKKQIDFIHIALSGLQDELINAKKVLADFLSQNNVEKLKAEIASKLVTLYGVSLQRNQIEQYKDEHDYINSYEPFLKQYRKLVEIISFETTPHYDQALLPRKIELERQLASLQDLLANDFSDDSVQKQQFEQELTELRSQLNVINQQIDTMSTGLDDQLKTIAWFESERSTLQREVQIIEESISDKQPLLNEAKLMANRSDSYRYSDISPNQAIAPDKRVWPRRSLLVIVGTVMGFILLCGLTFFLNIWHQVTLSDDEFEKQHNNA